MKHSLVMLLAVFAAVGAHAQPAPANVTGGPKSATYMPEAHKRAIRAQQKEDDKRLQAEIALQKKGGAKDVQAVDGEPTRKDKDR